MDEVYAAIVENKQPAHSGAWGLASLEVCVAILESARRDGSEVSMTMQVPYTQD